MTNMIFSGISMGNLYITKEKYFKFLFIVGVVDVNVGTGENKESDDDKDNLSAGSETGNMNLAKFSEDDAADTIQNCAYCKHYASN